MSAFPGLPGAYPTEPQLQLAAELLKYLFRQLTAFRGQILIHQERRQSVGKPLTGNFQPAAHADDVGLNITLLQHVAKTLLRQPNKGVKEIAYELDFPDLSFFGRYVKKNLGVSPRQFREQALLARAEGGGME